MKQKNHYVPRFILRRFGKRINLYCTTNGEFRIQESPDCCYFAYGRYPYELERDIANRIEVHIAHILGVIEAGGRELEPHDEMQIRRFVFVSYLRSLRPEVDRRHPARKDILAQCVKSDSFPVELRSSDKVLLTYADRIQNFLAKANISIVEADGQEDYMICDAGPVFDSLFEPKQASYPFSPRLSVMFRVDDTEPLNVVESNILVLRQCVRNLTYSDLSRLHQTMEAFATEKYTSRFDNLRITVAGHAKYGSAIRQFGTHKRERIINLEVPTEYLELIIDADATSDYFRRCVDDEDYENLAKLVVLQQHNLVNIPVLTNWMLFFESADEDLLVSCIKKYGEHPTCEFDKCMGAVFTELYADRDHGKALTEIGLLYLNGLHVRPDFKKSRRYLERAAKTGQEEAIECMVQIACDNGDEEQALSYLQLSTKENCNNFFIIGESREENGDITGAMEMYEQAANGFHPKSLFNVFRHYLQPENFDLDRVERYIPFALKSKSFCLSPVLKYYESKSTEDPECHQKLISLIRRMRNHGLVESEEWVLRYKDELSTQQTSDEGASP